MPVVAEKFASQRLLSVVKILSDPMRLRILAEIWTHGSIAVTPMCQSLGQTQPLISHHLKLLKVSGIVQNARKGKQVFYELTSIGEQCVKSLIEIHDQI